MITLSTLFLLTSTALVAGQRPYITAFRPVGNPDTPNRSTPDILADRFGENTTERLPIDANGDRDLVDRLSKLPIDKQPLWFIKWQAYEEHQKKAPIFPQTPNNAFVQPINSKRSNSRPPAVIDPVTSKVISSNSGASSSTSADSSQDNNSKSGGLGQIAGTQDADRFGENTTERLSIEANGDRDLVDRLSKLPNNKQPFWFMNWHAYETSSWANSFAYSSSADFKPGEPRPISGILSTNSVQSNSESSNSGFVNVNTGVLNMNNGNFYSNLQSESGSFTSSTGVPSSDNTILNAHSNLGLRSFISNIGALNSNGNSNANTKSEYGSFNSNTGVPVSNNGNSDNVNIKSNTGNSGLVTQNFETLGDRFRPVQVQNHFGIQHNGNAPNYNYSQTSSSFNNRESSSSISVRYG